MADVDDVTLPGQLNDFYSRFDSANISSPAPAVDHSDEAPFVISEAEVQCKFLRLNEHKAAGPDGISPCLLKTCAAELAGVFTDIFNLSLIQRKVPSCFKQSIVIPIPKKNTVSCLNDYRPVALTSIP